MDRYKRHVFICLNEREPGHPKGCCKLKNSEEVFRRFRSEISALDLGEEIKASKSGCLSACETGVTVVVYPDGVWYKGVEVDDVEEIVEQHLIGGTPVERLRLYPQNFSKD